MSVQILLREEVKFFLWTLFILCLSCTKSILADQVKGRITCYYGQWSVYRDGNASYPVEDLPGNRCTHIVYAFIVLDPSTWTVTHLDEDLDVNQNNLNRFLALRQTYPGLKLSIAVGGGSDAGAKYSQMANDPSKRASFITSLVRFMNQYSFDGMDIDWEYPGVDWTGGQPYDKDNFISFLRELRIAFDQQGKDWEITTAVSIVESTINVGYKLPDLCNLVDAVHIMGYDMHGAWDGKADVHSPLYRRPWDVNQHINLNTNDGSLLWNDAGCPRYKLIIGIPFYGRGFVLLDSGDNQPGAPINHDASVALPDGGAEMYSQLCQNVGDGSWTRNFESIGMCPYIYRGNNWIGYDDPLSILYKTDWIKYQGYGGAMVWAIDQDDFRGWCGVQNPLITTIYNSLKDYEATTP